MSTTPRTLAEQIVAEQSSVYTNDAGHGSAGPGMIDAGTLAELVESGEIDDYEIVDGPEAEEIIEATLDAHQHDRDDGTRWIVARRTADDGQSNPYRNYLLLWDTIDSTEDLYLYDSETNDMLSAEDIGITAAEYVAACRESAEAAPEGHVMVAGRRVYAAE